MIQSKTQYKKLKQELETLESLKALTESQIVRRDRLRESIKQYEQKQIKS